MKILRFLFVALSLVSLSLFSFAEKKEIDVKTNTKSNTGSGVHRAPMRLPIEVVFDTEALTIEVSCSADLEAEVFIYNAECNLEDYSPCLNTVLSVSPSQFYNIIIEGDSFICTGVIE